MNHVSLIGRLTFDNELKQTNSGVAILNNRIAVKRKYKNDETDFINITAWRKTAELLHQYTRKGSLIGINGRIETNSYENQEGQKINTFVVIVDDITFLEPKQDNQQQNQQSNNNQQYNYNGDSRALEGATRVTGDGLPF